MKRKNYIWMLIVSAILTAIIFLKMYEGITREWEITCDFIAMIGAGILCSTIVSLIIDIQNQNKSKRDKKDQRNFIFATIKQSMIHLFQRELSSLSIYYSKYLAEQEAEWIKEEISLSQISKKILCLLEAFEEADNETQKSDLITITPETIRQDDEKKFYLITSNMLCYKSLYQALLNLSSSYDMYFISDLIDKQQVELLKELTWEIDDILLYDKDISIDEGMILEFKKILFKKTEQYISVFDSLENVLVHVHYKNCI